MVSRIKLHMQEHKCSGVGGRQALRSMFLGTLTHETLARCIQELLLIDIPSDKKQSELANHLGSLQTPLNSKRGMTSTAFKIPATATALQI